MAIRTMQCPNCCVKLEFPNGVDRKECRFCRGTIYWKEDLPDEWKDLDLADSQCNSLLFTDAFATYKKVLMNSPTNPRALWGMVKCAYGVQVVCEDGTNKRFLICNIRNNQPVQNHPHFIELMKQTLSEEERRQYLLDAGFIDACQTDLEQAAQDGVQWDVYFCYKEQDRGTDGSRTDSVDKTWVREVYERLRSKVPAGVRIFYAPEALYGLTGASYAAGIANALSTSRIMLLLCSQRDYLQTTWVKSEYDRFLYFIDQEQLKRRIIPVYRGSTGMRPEDFPQTILAQKIQCIDYEKDPETFLQNAANQIDKQLNIPDPRDHYRKDQKKYDDLLRENASLKSRYEEVEKKHKELSAEMQTISDLKKQTEIRLAETENKTEQYLLQLADMLKRWTEEKQAREKAERELGGVRTRAKDFENQNSELTGKVSSLQQQLQEGDEKAKALQSAMDRTKAEAEKQISQLRADLEKVMGEAQSQTETEDQLRGLIKSLKVSLDAAEQEARAQTETGEKLNEQMTSLRDELEKVKSEAQAHTGAETKLQEEVVSLRSELEQARSDAQTKTEAGEKLQELVASLKDELGKAKSDAQTKTEAGEKLQEQVTTLKAELEQAKGDAQMHLEAGEKLQEQVTTLTAELEQARDDAQMHLKSGEKLQEQVTTLTAELEQAKGDAQKHSESGEKLEEQVRTLETELKQARTNAQRQALADIQHQQEAAVLRAELDKAAAELKKQAGMQLELEKLRRQVAELQAGQREERHTAAAPRLEIMDSGFYASKKDHVIKLNFDQERYPSSLPVEGVFVQIRSLTGSEVKGTLKVLAPDGRQLFAKSNVAFGAAKGTICCFPVKNERLLGQYVVQVDDVRLGEIQLRSGQTKENEKSSFLLDSYGFLAKDPTGRTNRYSSPLRNNKYCVRQNVHYLFFSVVNTAETDAELVVRVYDAGEKCIYTSTSITAPPKIAYRIDVPFEGDAETIHQDYTVTANNVELKTVHLDGRQNA